MLTCGRWALSRTIDKTTRCNGPPANAYAAFPGAEAEPAPERVAAVVAHEEEAHACLLDRNLRFARMWAGLRHWHNALWPVQQSPPLPELEVAISR